MCENSLGKFNNKNYYQICVDNKTLSKYKQIILKSQIMPFPEESKKHKLFLFHGTLRQHTLFDA